MADGHKSEKENCKHIQLMKTDHKILCSVIVLNYNGAKIIENCIAALKNLSFPANEHEIIIVDNKSQDNSISVIKNSIADSKNIKLICSPTNAGFAAGNNLGIAQARGKYIALLNNDCIVHSDWLTELVRVAENGQDIFSVNSKIYLYPRFLRLKTNHDLETAVAEVTQSKLLSFFQSPLIAHKKVKNGKTYFDIPLDPRDTEVAIKLSNLPKNYDIAFEFSQGEERGTLENSNSLLTISNITKTMTHNKIQNCGSTVFHDGYGRDIGSLVSPGVQDYEIDTGQYDTSQDVFSTCGAATLYNKSILEKIGGLEQSFFMYYEDTEIAWRANIYGYLNVTAPQATVRHMHAFSSSEWSDFFVTEVEYGRLLCLYFSAPDRVFYYQYLKFCLHTVLTISPIRMRVVLRFVRRFFKNRRMKTKLYPSELASQKITTYNQLLTGKWLIYE